MSEPETIDPNDRLNDLGYRGTDTVEPLTTEGTETTAGFRVIGDLYEIEEGSSSDSHENSHAQHYSDQVGTDPYNYELLERELTSLREFEHHINANVARLGFESIDSVFNELEGRQEVTTPVVSPPPSARQTAADYKSNVNSGVFTKTGVDIITTMKGIHFAAIQTATLLLALTAIAVSWLSPTYLISLTATLLIPVFLLLTLGGIGLEKFSKQKNLG